MSNKSNQTTPTIAELVHSLHGVNSNPESAPAPEKLDTHKTRVQKAEAALLDRKTWAMLGNLIAFGVIEMPPIDVRPGDEKEALSDLRDLYSNVKQCVQRLSRI